MEWKGRKKEGNGNGKEWNGTNNEGSESINFSTQHCNHERESERSFVGTYATMELDLALQKGYRIIK